MTPETHAQFEAIFNRILLYSVAALTVGLASLAYLVWAFPPPNRNPPNVPPTAVVSMGTFAGYALLLAIVLCVMAVFERKRIRRGEQVTFALAFTYSAAPTMVVICRGWFGV